ncbi:serine aminopeptidase S33 family [Lacibacter cauensis]|uniref:Serine aminopeptidase S33 family n=1 Tax=Lacibacter cauensis TaxID=510947 RepID=A0A562SV97_9BACT|nr:alpha/beta hydrolase [Lacibacter cauensis]TWI85103.1 serine aminopeptidase S33 family [Lacibacter cauensis]
MKLAQKLVIGYYRTKLNIFAKLSKRKAAEKAFELFCTPYTSNKKKAPALFEKAEKLHLKVEQYNLVGYRWNHPQPKKALILHGFSSTVKKFDHFVMPLVKKGYEVIAFDAPAHGDSNGKTINVYQYRDTIKKVYERFGPIHSFIAHSFGGLALSLFMEEQPYQENKKLVLIAPATETESALNSFAAVLNIDEEVKEEMRKIIFEKSGHTSDKISVRHAANKIKADVLWIHDEDDDVTPWTDAEKVKQDNHPNFQFMLTKGLGHRRIYRDNKVKKAIMEFL